MKRERQNSMPTQEDRLTALEQTTTEYRPVLQNIAYELTMVKGLTVDQIGITQELRQNMNDVKERLTRIEEQLNSLMSRFDTGGEVDFRRDVLLFLSTKGGRYSPPRRKNTLFWWHLPPLFDFATSIALGANCSLGAHMIY